MKKAALLIDGGMLRAHAGHWNLPHATAHFVQGVAKQAFNPKEEEIFRILYYDCPPYLGPETTPIRRVLKPTGRDKGDWLEQIGALDFFAVRKGVCKFRGWTVKPEYYQNPRRGDLDDDDFDADIEQKGVDMRIGLDIAVLAETRAVERIILLAGDTDFIPAVKHGRKAGIQMVLAALPNYNPPRELRPYFDIYRPMERWP